MAAPTPRDPLDALQSLIDDVLIQTGKALRVSRKDVHGNLTQMPEIAQPRLPETIRQYHCALDQLESEILRAKSVLLRDLNQIQERRRLLIKPEPQPVEPQSRLPIAIDLDSPSPPGPKDGSAPSAREAPRALMAPFPNMSIALPSDPGQMDIIAANNGAGSTQPPSAHPLPMPLDAQGGNPSNPGAHPGTLPPPAPDSDLQMDLHHGTATGMPGASGMNFTDMEFSLAPPLSADLQGPANPNDTAFDLATFAPADGRDDALGMMGTNFTAGNINMNMNISMNSNAPPPPPPPPPSSLAAQHASLSANNAHHPNAQEKVEDKKGEAADSSKFHDLFGNDSGAADGMDFDFSLGGGEETFSGRDGGGVAVDFPMDGAGGGGGGITSIGTISGGGGGGGGSSSSNAIVNNGGLSSSDFDAMIMGLDKPGGP